ncbi:voltage-gated ClC-type chloride channel ClcB, partial [Enterobacter hormaechei]|nr:voltage-gated ClC-type chloride channel ClcB [Enterobacter hormaechei]
VSRRPGLGEKGEVLNIVAEPRRIANRIVEEAMISANICAARVLRDKLGFGIYNVHTGFDPANTEALAALLKTHDVHVDPEEVLTLQGFCKLRRELDAQPSGFLDSRIRRFQSFAEISTEPGPHFGLGLEAYATWTSPIRKYGDMVNHRLLKAIIKGESVARPQDDTTLQMAERRRLNRMAERDVGDWLYAQRLHAYPDIRAMFRRLLIATVTGVLAALAVAVFRHSMYLLEWLFLSNESGSLVNAAAALSPWRRALTPVLGGLAAGVLLWGWQRMTAQRPHAPTDYMEALETGDGQFDYGASLVKSLASLLVVASGSAIGREGAMILLAALAASFFAQRCTPKSEWKLWIACGAAAGMASAYHAPLAGSLFIAEILFGTLMLASLGPVVIAAVVALLTTRLLSPGANTLYDVHLSEMLTAVDYFLIVGVGLLAGVCGPLLMWLMAASHRLFLRLKLSPPWQLALGGPIVGLLSLLTPKARPAG